MLYRRQICNPLAIDWLDRMPIRANRAERRFKNYLRSAAPRQHPGGSRTIYLMKGRPVPAMPDEKLSLRPAIRPRNIGGLGGGFALASGFRVTGLGEWLAGAPGPFAVLPLGIMMLLLSLVVIFASEIASNTALARLLIPV
jgi:hypothetical protein